MTDGSSPHLQIFVSEYVTGGAWPEGRPDGSLAQEGAAMLQGVVADLAAVPGLDLQTTWDLRLGPADWSRRVAVSPQSTLRVHEVETADQEARWFAQLSTHPQSVLVIAPELDGLLTQRCQQVERCGGRLLGPNSTAAALCADKWELARWLGARGLPTIPTELCDLNHAPSEGPGWPRVVKPRWGAGSTSTFRLDHPAAYAELQSRRRAEPALSDAVVQPWIRGTPASVAVLCEGDGGPCHPLPMARQRLSRDGRFHYLGGELPLHSVWAPQARELASAACRTIPGLRGFVGVDLLLDEEVGAVTLVEINPRLTTSYLGYRQLALEHSLAEGIRLSGGAALARAVVWPRLAADSLVFCTQTIGFSPDDPFPHGGDTGTPIRSTHQSDQLPPSST
jgi:predicted ATP-grasp superfamily ATP-dependent carboligase